MGRASSGPPAKVAAQSSTASQAATGANSVRPARPSSSAMAAQSSPAKSARGADRCPAMAAQEPNHAATAAGAQTRPRSALAMACTLLPDHRKCRWSRPGDRSEAQNRADFFAGGLRREERTAETARHESAACCWARAATRQPARSDIGLPSSRSARSRWAGSPCRCTCPSWPDSPPVDFCNTARQFRYSAAHRHGHRRAADLR